MPNDSPQDPINHRLMLHSGKMVYIFISILNHDPYCIVAFQYRFTCYIKPRTASCLKTTIDRAVGAGLVFEVE